MKIFNKRNAVFLSGILLFSVQPVFGGPPFLTDDPEPVPFHHWEYYISSISTMTPNVWSGTSPHFEVNYGIIPGTQIHLLLPLNYTYVVHHGSTFGYADTELGFKLRFLKETDKRPQVGTFPIIQVPTVKNSEFSDGKVKVFIPVWVQKSWRNLTTYGGAGYTFNPGPGNKNSVFTGWELQYDFSPVVTLGGELYYQSADAVDSKSVTAFNLGGSLNPSEKFHFIFSFGHSLTNERFFTSYLGLLWTI